MRKLLSLFLAAVLLILCLPAVSAADVTVSIQGVAIPYDWSSGSPYFSNGTLMLPVEQTMKYYGAVVEKDAVTGETLLQLGTKEVRLCVGNSFLIANGHVAKLPAPITASSGVLYAPAKALITALGGYCTDYGTTLDIDPQCLDYEMIRLEEYPPADSGNVWTKYNEATNLRNAGRYAEAIPGYTQCIYTFLHNNSFDNLALVYEYLGICYARTGQYDRAAAAYSRSSYYWEKAGSPGTPLAMYECARYVRTELSLYLHTTDLTNSQEKTHGVRFEPERGIVLGYTTQADKNTYPNIIQPLGKTPGMRLIYFSWGAFTKDSLMNELTLYGRISPDTVVEFAVQPINGYESVKNEDVVRFAQILESSGRPVMVRYANEMNDPNTSWHVDGATYRNEYIRFASIMRQYAPSVPLIWAPNFHPMNNVDDYYPGDAYVDYVGVSSYLMDYYCESWEQDYNVFGDGRKYSRWSQQLDYLYSHYGFKKPLMIAEGAASYADKVYSEHYLPEIAAEQIREFYTYLPMRYPNMKYAVYFDITKEEERFKWWMWKLDERPELAAAYLDGIADDQFLSSYTGSSQYCYVPFETLNETVEIDGKKQDLTAFVRFGKNTEVKSVRYEINGAAVGTSAAAPYKVSVDFRKYSDQKITLRLVGLDAYGNELVSKRFTAKVRGVPGKSGFYDVPDNQYFADPVLWAVQNGVTSGMDATHFAPNDGCTRGQVVTFLWRTAGKPKAGSSNNPFTDVKKGKYYYDAVLWAIEKGITNGMSPTTFEPDTICNRGQIVTFLWRYKGQTKPTRNDNPFIDVEKGKFFYNAVLWAVEKKVTTGMTATTFEPDSTCTRGQVVTFLYRAEK